MLYTFYATSKSGNSTWEHYLKAQDEAAALKETEEIIKKDYVPWNKIDKYKNLQIRRYQDRNYEDYIKADNNNLFYDLNGYQYALLYTKNSIHGKWTKTAQDMVLKKNF